MCTYLAKRGATYYFRRGIPAELRPALGGKLEFMISLRTKDRETAKRLIPTHTAATDKLLDQARSQIGQEAPERPAEHVSVSEPAMTPGEREQAEFEAEQARERQARWNARAPDRAEIRRQLATLQSVDLPVSLQAARDLLRERDEAIAKVEAQLAGREAGRLADVLPPSIGDTGAMLDTIIVDRWAAERKVVKKGIDTHRAVARWFYERVGRKPVREITRADVLVFKDKLIAEGQSPANTIMKLSRLRTLLQWAADNDFAATNAAQGVRLIDTERAKNKRLEFDLPSLNRIFSSPVYSEGARPAGGKGEAAYWLPLLALFTGARLEELGQLRPGDVKELAYPDADGVEHRAWFIAITEDEADDLKLKNAGSERVIPVHTELERLGFLKFVADAVDAGQARLFPRLRPNVYGRLTAKWGEWFGPYLRNVCGITDRRLVFHSFRHTFKQYARHVGMIEGVQRQLMGHSSGDTADEYLIGQDAAERNEILDSFSEIYEVRSAIIHRGKSRISHKERSLFYKLRKYCRRVISAELNLLPKAAGFKVVEAEPLQVSPLANEASDSGSMAEK